MELSKHKNHRNINYLNWLRKMPCAASGKKAQCAHHIRIGTNGGSSMKPSDYFCIPLLNEYHTTGLLAIHIIGEETFLKEFNLNKTKLFISYLKSFITETLKLEFNFDNQTDEGQIASLIELIESKRVKREVTKKTKKSITENAFYQKSKEAKKILDKELRQKIKQEKALNQELETVHKSYPKKKKSTSSSFKGNEYYERAKELKRARDKELREKIKLEKNKKAKSKASVKNDYYEKAKELKRARDKEFRAKLKDQRKKSK